VSLALTLKGIIRMADKVVKPGANVASRYWEEKRARRRNQKQERLAMRRDKIQKRKGKK